MKIIRLYLNENQRKKFIDWFNTARFVYNKIVDAINNRSEKINNIDLRNTYVTGNGNNLLDFERDTPKVIRQQAVYDCCKAFKTCFSQLKSGLINKFNVKFKSKRNKVTSIGIEQSWFSQDKKKMKMTKKYDSKTKKYKDKKSYNIKNTDNTITMFRRILGKSCNIKIGKRQKKELKDLYIENDCRISYDGLHFCLCIPVINEKEIQQENNNKETIALDPGTRCFSTGYDPNGNILEFHRRDQMLFKLKNKISNFQ